MNKYIRHLILLFSLAFIVLCMNLTYLQVFAAQRIASHPRNIRGMERELAIARGAILSSDGQVLAESKKARVNRRYQRIYPQGKIFAPLTGYYSLRYGRSGLEAAFNDHLLGKREISSFQDYLSYLMGEEKAGHTLILTIDSRLQNVTAKAMGDQRGAVVVLNPKTGEILAMVSNPSYDPNPLASLNIERETQAWNELIQDEAKPLLNRALQELYPPGSAFKLVTASAALETGLVEPSTQFTCTGRLTLPLTRHTLRDFGGKSHGKIDFAHALELSCNNTFGEIGLKLGAKKLVNYAEGFGINLKVPFELPVVESKIPQSAEIDPPGTAMSAIGQKDVRLTPLQMTLVAGGIANQGVIMRPYVVKEIRDYSGKILRRFHGEEWLRPISPKTASTLTELMKQVVESGTGRGARLKDISVAGKTGTAQVAKGAPHAWFVCFAPADDPQIAVAVIVENGGSLGSEATGGRVAAPIAKQIISAALKNKYDR
ncbi:MAG: penicillin-binding transpeptidase domain-containing protein [Actinomycetota bacterium]|nr:penicillin-binding transpeptidase domain-containing protein [Actinomycetota bacterium]